MYHSLLPLIGWAATLAVCLFAWWRGGPPERAGATLKVATSAVAFAVHHLLKQDSISVALLFADGVLAAGFLILTLRYTSLWLGTAMLLQGAQFSLHAYYLVVEMERDRFYAIANNVITSSILLCILIGTLWAWRRRSVAKPA